MKKKIIIGSSIAALLMAGGIAIAAPGGVIDSATAVTRADFMAKADARFIAKDFDKDGKLTPADRTAAQKARADARFALLDADKNGQITRAEFDAADAKRDEMRGERGRDGEGRRGHHGREDRHHMGKGKGMGGGLGFGGMKAADANKDGAITLQEYRAQATAVFTKMDANNDGSLTSAERKAAREAVRAQRDALRDQQDD